MAQDGIHRATRPGLQSETPEVQAEARTHEFLTSGYTFGESYVPPALSGHAKQCAGYVRDAQPPDFNNQCLVRAAEMPVHTADFQATVSGRFVDQRFFSELSIVLEILQNAEPRDSKGTWFDLQFYADGQWRSVVDEMGQYSNEQIEKVRIVDNGKGYLPTDMVMIGGAKRDDPTSAGNFGTGMKISDRSAVERGVNITRYSRNWRAVPELRNTVSSAGPEQLVRYKTEFFEQCRPGSIVEYSNMTPAMLDILRKIEDYYLPLDPTLPDRILDETQHGLVLSPKNQTPQIMVKGRFYTLDVEAESPFLFSYDLRDCTIDDQNRYFVSTARAQQNIRLIFESCKNEAVFKRLLENHEKDYFELGLPGLKSIPDIFQSMLKEHFEIPDFAKSFIEEGADPENIKILKRRGYKAVRVGKSRFIKETLMKLGTVEANEFMAGISSRVYHGEGIDHVEEAHQIGFLTTSALAGMKNLASDDCCDLKAEEVEIIGIVEVDGLQTEVSYRDLISQELPNLRCLKIRTKNSLNFHEEWYDPAFYLPRSFKSLFAAIKAIPVEGYMVYNNLEYSSSGNGGSRGVLRRSWPDSATSRLEVTIIIDSQDHQKQAQGLSGYSLNLNPNYSPFERTKHGDIVSLKDGKIYKNGVLKSSDKASDSNNCVLSYNVEGKDPAKEILAIVSSSERIEVAKAVLSEAKSAPKEKYIEYEADIDEGNRPLWKEAFESIFGVNAVIDDLSKSPFHDYADNLAQKSAIELPNLSPSLVNLLKKCGVKCLSSAVKAERVRKYTPVPLQENLLQIARFVDKAVAAFLPEGIEAISQGLQVIQADSVLNEYGQKLDTKSGGYMDPLCRDATVYVADSVLKPSNVADIAQLLVNKRIQAYRASLSDEEFTAFKVRVITAMGNYITPEFLAKFRTIFGNWISAGKTVKVIDVQLSKVSAADVDKESEEFDLRKATEKAAAEKAAIEEAEAEKARKAQEKAEKAAQKAREKARKAQEKAREKAERAAKKAPKSNKPLSLPSFPKVGRVAGGIALMATLAVAGVVGVRTSAGRDIQGWADQKIGPTIADLRQKLSEIFSSDDDGFERSDIDDNFPVGVDVENTSPGDEDLDEYIRHVAANFVSQPALSWGSFMSEKVMNWFDGKKWTFIQNENMALPLVDFPTVKRIAHYQKITPSSGQLKLRPIAGGRIDIESIELIGVDGKRHPIANGQRIPQTEEVELTIPEEPKIGGITYQTLANSDWESTAESLSEADLAALPQGAYRMLTYVSGYTTDDYQVDYAHLSQIKLRSEIFREYSNLGDFIKYVRTLSPYERVKTIRTLVNKMRYTTTSRTAKAFEKFHDDDLPEKDLIEFAFNSSELEQQGDGDCDVQNSLFALLTRIAGVPSKLEYVLTESGVGHAPASIYLPKIGWVLMDTMGEKTLQENRQGETWVIHNHVLQRDALEAQKALQRKLRLIEQDRRRGCGILIED